MVSFSFPSFRCGGCAWEISIGFSPILPRHPRAVIPIHRKKINLSTCLAGEAVGIQEVDDSIWLVTFMEYDLGYVDLEEKTLQPAR